MMMAALLMSGCSQQDETDSMEKMSEWNSSAINFQLVGLYENACCPYADFWLRWDNDQNSDFEVELMRELLLEVDDDGELFCDCRNEGEEQHTDIIDYIDIVINGEHTGFHIVLIDTVYLEESAIRENLEKIFTDHKYDLFRYKDFAIW